MVRVLRDKKSQKNTVNFISGIFFTNRELDVISCLISGKMAKSIANLLSTYDKNLGLRSVETHILNIRRKIGAASKGNIIDFIEKSGRYPFFREHYIRIVIKRDMEDCIQQLQYDQSLPPSLHVKTTFYLDDTEDIFFKIFWPLLSTITANIQCQTLEADTTTYKIRIIDNKINGTKNIINVVKNDDYIDFESGGLQIQYDASLTLTPYLVILDILTILYPNSNDLIRSSQETIKKKFANELTQINGNIKSQQTTSIEKKYWQFSFLFLTFSILILLLFVYNKFQQVGTNNLVAGQMFIPSREVLLNRDEMLQEIRYKLNTKNNISTIVIHGDGGSGKTTLARLYAQTQKFNLTWEINAENIESIRESFGKLIYKIKKLTHDDSIKNMTTIVVTKENEDEIIEDINNYLSKLNRWILIFDNLEDFALIQKYYPTSKKILGKGKIIITSRNTNLKNHDLVDNNVQIGPLSNAQKIELFSKIQKKVDPSIKLSLNSLNSFLSNIPPYPLDIMVAANYLNATGSTPESYLQKLNCYTDHCGRVQSSILTDSSNYLSTRDNIISFSIDKILDANPEFAFPLVMISMLNPQQIQKQLIKAGTNQMLGDQFIYYLKKYSLIMNESIRSTGYEIGIHRTIQSSIFYYLQTKIKKSDFDVYILRLVNLLKDEFASNVTKLNIKNLNVLFNHARHLLKHRDLLSKHLACSLGLDLGMAYYYLGFSQPSIIKEFEDSINCAEGLHLPERDLIIARVNLSHMYRKAGIYDKAEELCQKNLKYYSEHKLKDIHLGTSYCCLGAVYSARSKYQEAEEYFKKSLKIVNEVHGTNFEKAHVLTYLGFHEVIVGKPLKAKKIFEESTTNYADSNENTKNPVIVWNLIGLGRVYNLLADYEKAETNINKALQIIAEYFPYDEADTAFAKRTLAEVKINQKQYQEAENLLMDVLTIYKKTSSNENILLAAVYDDLAHLYMYIKDYQKAESYADLSLNIYKNAEHPFVLNPLKILGEIYIIKSLKNTKNASRCSEYRMRAIEYLETAGKMLNTPTSRKQILELLDQATNHTCAGA